MFDYRLALVTGVDIPFPEIQMAIHQPTISEISMLGEQVFFLGVQMLCVSKQAYIQDERLLVNTSNFQIFMTIVQDPSQRDKKDSVLQVMSLLFPQANTILTPRSLIINSSTENSTIDEGNFEKFQKIIQEMFCLSNGDESTFNPSSKRAQEIANKLMKARQRVAAEKAKSQGNQSMFGQYLSVLAVGIGSMSLQDCINLTVYQLYELLERYSLYINWDLEIRSRLAGAKGDKPVDNWMKPIH